jgi:N-carbamoylputrescine amidase
MTRLRVALLQPASHGANVPTALAEGERWCRSAAALGADVAVLPELWQLGYQACPSDPGARAVWTELATEEGEPFVEHFRALAVELRMAIVITYLQRRPGAPRNAATLIDRDGRTLLTYAKVHTCDFAGERFLAPGTEFPVAKLVLDDGATVTVGVMTCFDREQPEAARALMLAGAEVILVPNACVLDEERIGQVRARAFENMAGIAVANYAAPGAPPPADPVPANGHSVAFSGVCYQPDGRPRSSKLVEAGEDESVSIATFDLDALRAYRAREPWGDAYRRPAAYGGLLGRGTDLRMRRPDARAEEVPGDGALTAQR